MVGDRLARLGAVGDNDAYPGSLQHGIVILCIPYGENVGQPEAVVLSKSLECGTLGLSLIHI